MRRPRPRHSVPFRRPVPLDPLIDPGLDPLIEPWAAPLSQTATPDEGLFEDPAKTDDFTPGGGDFGGGGASGSWDDGDNSGDNQN